MMEGMSAGTSQRETEIKLRVESAEHARRLLRRSGFRVLQRRVFEANTVFDTPLRLLYERGCLIRLRQAAHAAILTYKGPATVARHKSREELELQVSDATTLALVLERLGFMPVFRYEKFRTEYRDPDGTGLTTLDETPIGEFLELEGEPDWIDHTARRLGFSERDYITASYAALYLKDCARRGFTPGQMVFRKRARRSSTKVPPP
jgi:adenylate cyclase, class 2